MYCEQCNTKILKNSKFCNYCGKKIDIKNIDFRICPFCKEKISKKAVVCPYCKRVLIEEIKRGKPLKKFNFLQQLKKLNFCRINFKALIMIIFFLFFCYSIFNEDNSSDDYWEQNNEINILSDNIKYNPPKIKIPARRRIKTDFSLPNNEIINSYPYYLNGFGELIIDNGTDYDAVAKLIKPSIDKSIYFVYMKANSKITIKNISDGIYELLFCHGNDWNIQNNQFNFDQSFSKFEDLFHFITKEEKKYDGIYDVYSVFEVTLHGIIGGTAKTGSISENEFNKY